MSNARSAKRTQLDLAALQAAARPQPNPVEAANRDAPPVRAASSPSPLAVPRAETRDAPAARQASRVGKVGVQFWTAPDTRKTLKRAAMELERTVDDLVNEAVAEWIAGKGPF